MLHKLSKKSSQAKKSSRKDKSEASSGFFNWWPSSSSKHKSTGSLELNDFCCFRDPAMKRHVCEPIPEDEPETKFDRDVAILELNSVLRHHSIEPSESLVDDVLRWQLR